MKRILLPIVCVGFITSIFAQTTLSKEDRSQVLDHLKSTKSELLKTVKGLSEEQLNFKPNEETWSVAECVEHLAITENSLWGIVDMTLQNAADPSMRSEVKMSDDEILGLIQSREQKIKTQPEMVPTNKFGNYKGSLDEFKNKRASNLKYVKTTDDDLRNRYFDFPFGKVDSYQVILFMSGHTKRHTDQIKELIGETNFPSS